MTTEKKEGLDKMADFLIECNELLRCDTCYNDLLKFKSMTNNRIVEDIHPTCNNDKCMQSTENLQLHPVGEYVFCKDCIYAMARFVAINGI